MRVSPRLAAAAAAMIAVWFVALVPLHPNILERDVAEAVLDDGLWRLTHTAMFVVGIAASFVALGVIGLHPDRLGRAGTLATVAVLITGFSTAAAGAVEATAFPLLAVRSPEVIAFDGPLFTDPLFRAITGPWLLFPLSLAALGLLAYRDGAHRGPGAALAASGIAFFALGMWFVPVVGVVSCVALGGSLAWWAAILWAASPGDEAGPSR